MAVDQTDNYELDFDPKLLNRFIFLFNIARHHAKSYPINHPQIAKSVQNFLGLLDGLLEYRDDITIGVAKDNLIIGDASLEKNAVFKDLANSLFECDIASFTIRRSVTHDELLTFYQLITLDPEEIREKGGCGHLLRDAGVGSVRILDIDYSSFHSTEMESIQAPTDDETDELIDAPWESFISGLIEGSLSADGEKATADELDPATLAQLMNQQKLEKGKAEEDLADESYDATITSFFKEMDRQDLSEKARATSMIRLGNFVDQLNPDLRRDLLNSTFATLGDRTELAENMLSGVSPSTLIEIFGEASEDKITVPPGLLNLLAKLSEGGATDRAGQDRVIQKHTETVDEDIEERIRTIFQQGTPGEYIPPDYQKFLEDVLTLQKLDDTSDEIVKELSETLDGHEIETAILNVILDLIDLDPMSEQADLMTQNLIDLVHYFIEVGDFDALAKTYDRLQEHHEESEAFSIPIAEETLKIYDTDEFTDAVLDGLEIWGTEKHDAIRRLIGHIHGPFIEPIIKRLAEEEDMTMRQYLMSVLFEMGDPAKQALMKRLHDSRWYFVRNIIILLRRFDDPAVMQPMKRLIGHKHPKIHLEAMKTYLHFNDPKADRYLIQEMQSAQMERRKNAALLGRNSSNPAVHQELINILIEGHDDPEYELRAVALKSLAEIADPNFLPSLKQALSTRNLFRPGLHKEFKINILRSLVKYPLEAARTFLTEYAEQTKGDLADPANQILRRLPKGGRT